MLLDFRISGDHFCQDVVGLADVLVSCGGIECFADFYEQVHPPSWTVWTERKIEECAHVVLVCSPRLNQALSSGERCDVEMYRGKFFSDSVIHSIIAPKFVPVFLNGYEPKDLKTWLPSQLHSSRMFRLRYLREFHQSVFQPDHTQGKRNYVVSQNLGLPKHRGVASLVQYLRGEPEVVRPEMPQQPIAILPTAGLLKSISVQDRQLKPAEHWERQGNDHVHVQ